MAKQQSIPMEVPTQYPGKLTFRVVIACIMAASGGMIFGYDHGVSGNSIQFSSFFFN